jgi:hypothetical protein
VYAPAPYSAQQAAPAAQGDPQLDQLVAPIALYPDPLLAQLLPAATYPDQVQVAYQWLQANPNPPEDAIDAQPWAQNPNMKAMAHYPEALKVLNDDPQWTQSLGSAFNSDPKGVMAAIQDMRAQAQAAGNLPVGTTAQTVVLLDAGTISIQPVSVTAPVYVPVYDPVVVYTSPFVITWGTPYVVGPWLGYGVDWYGGAVFVGPWYGPWWHGGGWGYWHGWHADHYFYHDARWGRAPFVARAHWAVAPGIRGREAEFRRSVAEHKAVVDSRRAVARNNAVAHNNLARPGQPAQRPGQPGQRPGQPGQRPTPEAGKGKPEEKKE